MPRATVLTAVFNCEDYVALSVESALAQSETDIEVLVIDDGCDDGSLQRLQRFDDPRLRIISCGRQGQGAALNIGLAAASADYVAILDADDVGLPDRIRLQADFLDVNPGVNVVGSRFRPGIDAEGILIRRDVLPTEADIMVEQLRRFVTPMFHSWVMYRKSAVAAVGGYDESLICYKDTELYVRMIGRYGRRSIANLDAELSLKRLHAGQSFGPQSGVRTSPEGLRAAEAVKQRIAEILGGPAGE